MCNKRFISQYRWRITFRTSWYFMLGLLVIGPPLTQAGDNTALIVNSQPAGARVYLKGTDLKHFPSDKVSLGETPYRGEGYTFIDRNGDHQKRDFITLPIDLGFQVIVESEGYESAVQIVPPFHHNIQLQPSRSKRRSSVNATDIKGSSYETGAVEVSSDPVGARVYVNGELLGNTPYRFESKAGNYVLTLKHAGHDTVEEKIILDHGKTRTVHFDLSSRK